MDCIEMRRPRPLESDVDRTITQFLNLALPADAVHFHIPNGGYRLSVGELARLKAAGYVGGLPDRCVLWQRICVFFEVKRPGRPVLNDAQKLMFERFAGAGFHVPIAQSVDDVIAILDAAGIPLRVQGRLVL